MIAPADEAALSVAVADAAARRTPLAVVGGGTLSALGRPMQTAATLSTAFLTGITLYEPAEMVISARAGTPLADIEAALAENRQRLAFEPPDYRDFLAVSGDRTVGSVTATNLSGPRRIQAGATRDSMIGVRFVNGAGTVVKSGGRVMKNVTGYDLVKFLSGSWGTLGVFSEVTFKVSPVPETEASIVLGGLDDAPAIAALSAALSSPWGVTGAAHLPRQGKTVIRIDGFEPSVRARAADLVNLLRAYGKADIVGAEDSAELWRSVRDLGALKAPPGSVVWRLSVKPGDGPTVAAAIRTSADADVLYDWGGGLMWVVLRGGGDAGAALVRGSVAAVGGHAMLFRGPDEARLSVDVFQQLAPPVMALTRKLKAEFDPHGILNPGRMYPGI